MIFTDANMREALARYARVVRPDLEDLRDLAEGPHDEPFCAVCTTLLPVVNERLPGWAAAADILNYHDEGTYGIGREWNHEDDYAWAIGLTQVFVYHRCLKVYAAARELLAA